MPKFAIKSLRQRFAENVVAKVFAQLEKNSQSVAEDQKTDWLDKLTDNIVDEVAFEYIRDGTRDEQNLGFTILHYRHTTSIRGYLIAKRGISFNDVDDAVANVFAQFYKNIDKFRQDCRISTWLSRIANNIANDYWREVYTKRKHQELLAQQNPNITTNNKIIARQDDEQEISPDDTISKTQNIIFDDDFDNKRCLEQVKALLESEGNTYLVECLEVHRLESEGFSKQEISEKIGRTKDATKQFMSTCRKKLVQYPPLQECKGIFLRKCLEDVKADLKRDNSSDTEILNCLQAYLLKLSRKPTAEIANQIGKTSRETKAYFSKCKEKLMQHPAISKKCREWLTYFE
jgi:RNA polymerase sigma factor (sigma-70 family)